MIKLLSVVIVAGLFSGAIASSLPPDTSSRTIKCWTEWFNRDGPSVSGDWETLADLLVEKPGKVCPDPVDMEVTTVAGVSVADAGEVIHESNTTTGFVCRNEDQPDNSCEDYRVRFSCDFPFCGGVCWTRWYNRDRPSVSGDWETMNELRTEHPNEICEEPLFIEAVTTDEMHPAASTGQTFSHNSPTVGFVCENKDQTSGLCFDYKVRFSCPCVA